MQQTKCKREPIVVQAEGEGGITVQGGRFILVTKKEITWRTTHAVSIGIVWTRWSKSSTGFCILLGLQCPRRSPRDPWAVHAFLQGARCQSQSLEKMWS